jgi:hypothetical protein
MAGDVDGEGYKRGGVGEGSKIGVFEVALLSPATEIVAGVTWFVACASRAADIKHMSLTRPK